MPIIFVPMLGLLGVAIAMMRRHASLDRPAQDMAARVLRWGVGLLSARRAEWGRAMLGELDHIDGRTRRLRFALGCVIGALLLPPWGTAAAAVGAMVALAVGAVGVFASVVSRYELGGGGQVAMGILMVFLVGCLVGASALLRRPGVAVPGLLGGVFVATAWLSLSGFTLYDQIAPDIVPWHPLVIEVVVPFAVGAAGTLWARDPVNGRRVARLAGISAGLGLFLYWTFAVAVLGAGGPPDDSNRTAAAIVSDRLGNNVVLLLLLLAVAATVGWAGAAAAGPIAARLRPTTTGPLATRSGAVAQGLRLVVLSAVGAAAVVLALVSWLRGS
jgi:hypothetical protein